MTFRRHYLNGLVHGNEVLIDDTTIEHLDFEIPCDNESAHGSDTVAADWILWRVRCCAKTPAVVVICEACRQAVLRQPIGWCSECHLRFVPLMAGFFRTEPINRGHPPQH